MIVAFAAIGFGLFTVPVLTNLFMEDHYGTDTFERGVLGTIGGIGVLAGAARSSGKYYDRLYRRDPARALRFVGLTILPAARPHAGAVLHAQRHRCSRSWASRS